MTQINTRFKIFFCKTNSGVILSIFILMTMLLLALVSCNGNSNVRKAQELSGAGATFPLPFYNVVFEEFGQVNGDQVAYGGIGSGGGVRNLRDKIVDFDQCPYCHSRDLSFYTGETKPSSVILYIDLSIVAKTMLSVVSVFREIRLRL